MRFLADQNLEGPIITRLRSEGYDVAAISERAPSIDDPEVLALATAEERILLTNDKDFAELAFLQKQAAAGIVLLRLPEWSSLNKGQRLIQVLEHLGDRLRGSMTVVGERATRRRPLSEQHGVVRCRQAPDLKKTVPRVGPVQDMVRIRRRSRVAL